MDELPARTGLVWPEWEDADLMRRFKEGATLLTLMRTHQRTRGAIEARLGKHRVNLLALPTVFFQGLPGEPRCLNYAWICRHAAGTVQSIAENYVKALRMNPEPEFKNKTAGEYQELYAFKQRQQQQLLLLV